MLYRVGGFWRIIKNWMDKDFRGGFLNHFRKLLHGRGKHTVIIRQIADNVDGWIVAVD